LPLAGGRGEAAAGRRRSLPLTPELRQDPLTQVGSGTPDIPAPAVGLPPVQLHRDRDAAHTQQPCCMHRLLIEDICALEPGDAVEIHVPAGGAQERFRQLIRRSDRSFGEYVYSRCPAGSRGTRFQDGEDSVLRLAGVATPPEISLCQGLQALTMFLLVPHRSTCLLTHA
jgi:hypothetical protein